MPDFVIYDGEAGATRQLFAGTEAEFLHTWDAEIKRAAMARVAGSVNSQYEADELAQHARLKLLQLHRTGKSSAIPYVRTTIANAVRTVTQRDTVLAQTIELQDDLQAPANDDHVHDSYCLARQVRDWVQRLSPQLQSIYRLIYVEEMTQREVAKRLLLTQPRIAQLHRSLIQIGAVSFSEHAA